MDKHHLNETFIANSALTLDPDQVDYIGIHVSGTHPHPGGGLQKEQIDCLTCADVLKSYDVQSYGYSNFCPPLATLVAM